LDDPRDELRAALEGQEAKSNAAASGQRSLDDERATYEQNEAAVIARLQEMAAFTLAQLNEKAPAQPVPLNPKAGGLSRMLGTRTVVGWEITLEYYRDRLDRHILCPDGRLLIRPEDKRHSKLPPLAYKTLAGWVEWELREARRSSFEAAFRFNPAMQGPIKFSGGPKYELHKALNSKELLVKNALARILRNQGITKLA
jgi:hypothetical protein